MHTQHIPQVRWWERVREKERAGRTGKGTLNWDNKETESNQEMNGGLKKNCTGGESVGTTFGGNEDGGRRERRE